MKDRLTLLKSFWVIANQIGKDYAYDVVEGLYGHRSLRRLTIDEFERVVLVMQEKSGIRLRTQKKRAKRTYLTKEFFQEAGYEVSISTAQRNKISVLYDQSGVTKSHFLEILEHTAPEGYLGPKQAGKVIGALNQLIKRPKESSKASKPAPLKIPAISSKSGTKPSGYFYYEHREGHG